MMFGNIIKSELSVVSSILVGILSYFFGGIDALLTVFTTILVVDTVTGMLKAWNLGEYQSKKFRSGFVKKTGYLLGIIVTVQMDILLKSNGVLRDAVVTFFIANETISIIENLAIMGVKFPKAFTNAILTLQEKQKEDDEEIES